MTLIRRYPLVTFFVFAYALSWILWIPLVAAGEQVSPIAGLILIIAGGFGPFLSAIIVTAIVKGKTGLRELRNRILKWRVGIRWYLLVLSFPIIFALVSYGLYVQLGGTPQDFSSLQPWYHYSSLPSCTYSSWVAGKRSQVGVVLLCPDCKPNVVRLLPVSFWECSGLSGIFRCSSQQCLLRVVYALCCTCLIALPWP